MEPVISFISEHYPTIAFFLAILCVAVVATFKIAMYHASIQDTRQTVDELPCDAHSRKLDALPCELHTKILDMHSHKLDELKTEVVEVKMDVSEMKGLMRLHYESALAKTKSPETLTEEGEKLVSDYNLTAIVNNNWNKITASINALKTRNPYDIQEFSRKTAFIDTHNPQEAKFFSKEDIDKLKLIAFKTGYPLVLVVTQVMGILIRDKYFSENNIDVDEIDAVA